MPRILPQVICSYKATSTPFGVYSLETFFLLTLLCVSRRRDDRSISPTLLMTHMFARKKPMTIDINPYIVLEPVNRTSL